MKKDKLSDAVGMIDSDIIEEAGEKRQAGEQKPLRRRKPIYAAVAIFAAAAAAITGVVVVPRLTDTGISTDPVETTAITEAPVTSVTSAGSEVSGNTSLPFARERLRSSLISGIEAVGSDGGDIAADSEFRINLFGDVSEDELRSHLKLEPQNEFTLTRGTDGSYLLKAENSFDKGSMVRFTAEDDNGDVCDSWAFRTADKFEVASTYPYDGYTGFSQYSGIEIEFTSKPQLSGIRDHIEITPEAPFDVSVNDRTLYIVPKNGLKTNAAYTVKLKAGFPSTYGEALKEDYEFSFRTSAYNTNDGHSFLFTGSSSSGFSETFIPGDQPCVEIRCSDDLRSLEYETHLYRFGSSDDYFAAIKERAESVWSNDPITDTSGLTEVFSSKEVPFTREESRNYYYKLSYVMLPDDLAEGHYIADIVTKDSDGAEYHIQYMVQIAPLSVYALSLGEENIFFVNDTVTGQPADGAPVTLTVGENVYEGTVGKDGIAYVKTGGEHGRAVLNIGAKGSRYIDSYILSDAENIVYEDLYYLYLFTDREAYLPTDTVNVWGIIAPKSSETELPEDLKVTLDSVSKPVTVAPDGTFRVKFAIDSHLDSWWNPVTLKSGSDEIISKNIQIHEYEKPTYVIDVNAPEYVILPQLEPFEITFDASYYEGTPAEGLILHCNQYSSGKSTPEMPKTDALGKASAMIDIQPSEYENSWKMYTAFMSYQLSGVENDYSSYGAEISAFYRDRMDETEYDSDTRTLTVSLYGMEFDRIEDFITTTSYDGYYRWGGDYSVLKGDPEDARVSVTVTRSWSEEIENGSYYDYIEKKRVKLYKYEHRQEEYGPFYADTENGKAVFTDLPTDKKGFYRIVVNYNDSLGQRVEDNVYIGDSLSGLVVFSGTGESMYYDETSKNLVFRIDAKTKTEREANYYMNYSSFTEDENIRFDLVCSNNETKFTGKVLFAVYRSDFLTYEVHDLNDSSGFNFRATKDCIPDAVFCGAFFDGKHVYKAYGSRLFYAPGERGLKLKATSDREVYDAGEYATLNVNVKDVNGAPVGGATVLLSLVDEAAFAVADQNATPLTDLYRYIYYPDAVDYISYIQHFAGQGSGGEKGGGGPEATRKDFKDTAYFDAGETGEYGNAYFTVKLPDNLTTWRATFIAIYDTDEGRMLAGTTKFPVISTRPLFVTPIIHDTFVAGDDIAVSAKCAGLPADGKMTVNITGADTDETLEIGQQETANFGKLPTGEYKVLFSAEYDGNYDAVEKTITVVDTLLETYITNSCDLPELSEHIAPTKWPARITFFDKEYMFNTELLYNIACYTGDSLDMRIGAAYAARELGYMTDDEIAAMFREETADGYARLLPASAKSNTLTALMCAAVPESVSPSVKQTFENGLGAPDKAPANYMGLAALGEPVLDDIRQYLENYTVDYVPNGIYLSAALAYCGDYQSAYDTYLRFVPEITVNDSDPDAPIAYVTDETGKANEAYTKAALITASLLNMPEAECFARYLISDRTVYSGYALELVIYLENYIPKIEGDAVFTYTLDGETQTVKLDRHHPTSLEFTKDQFENADFKVQSGAVYTISRYIGRVDRNENSPSVKVTKSYEGAFSVGETITVHIHTSPYCSVYDVIPSCGKRTGTNVGGQLVRLYTDIQGNAQYTFTVSTAGNYVVEPTVAYNYADGTWGMSARDEITVGDGNDAA